MKTGTRNESPNNYKAIKKVRNDWGAIKPIVRVKQSAKLYNRKKTKGLIDE